MSAGKDMQAAAIFSETIEAQAADWLMERQDKTNWSQTDQAALDAWLAQSLAHRIAFLRLEATWGRTERLAALRKPSSDEPANARSRTPLLITGIAAAFVAIAALGIIGTNLLSPPKDRTYTTPVGGRALVSFEDGSKVELNTDTVLRTRMTTGERVVWLDRGEAYFRVKHDAAHPFVVIAGNHRITDLGTKFLVRRDAGRLEVALLEGSVRFASAKKSALLTPGDEIVAEKNISLTRKTAQELSNELGWRRGVLIFQHATLADAAAEFNRYNKQKIVIADAEASQRTIDGTFLANDIEAFTDAAQSIFGLRVKAQGDELVISH